MAELAYAVVSKTIGFGHEGSSPSAPTKNNTEFHIMSENKLPQKRTFSDRIALDAFETLDEVKETIQELVKINNRLQNENKKLKDEHYKDKKIQELQEKIETMQEDMHRGFSISKEQNERIKSWTAQHLRADHKINPETQNYGGAIGGTFSYKFIPTSIGVIGEVKCTCGKKFCFQDLD